MDTGWYNGREQNDHEVLAVPPRQHRYRAPVDSGNVPGNPLRSYRMAMLSHGFVPVDDSDRAEMKPDESDSISYAIVPLRRTNPPIAATVTVIVFLIAIVVASIVFG